MTVDAFEYATLVSRYRRVRVALDNGEAPRLVREGNSFGYPDIEALIEFERLLECKLTITQRLLFFSIEFERKTLQETANRHPLLWKDRHAAHHELQKIKARLVAMSRPRDKRVAVSATA